MNRQITISTGESRKATNWKKESMLWSEFVDRLKIPSKSTETLEEYMKLPKAKQDDLKDAGGFVAGELKDGKRKNINIKVVKTVRKSMIFSFDIFCSICILILHIHIYFLHGIRNQLLKSKTN